MKCLRKKQWLLAWITGAYCLLFLVGVAHAQKQPNLEQPLSGPLPPNHPAAKLDPNLLNVPAMPEPNLEQPLSGPLPPNHPAAKLDPNLLNVPAMPEPQSDTLPQTDRSINSPAREVSHDIRTGSTKVGNIRSMQPSSSPSSSPPNLGSDSHIQPEPPASVPKK